jgi:hypothetical protein
LLYEITVRSVIDYALPIHLKLTDLAHLDRLHYRAKLVTGDMQNLFFLPYMSKLWNYLNVSTEPMTLSDIEEQFKKELKQSKIKQVLKGSKIGNTCLTRIKLDRADLNLHKFGIGISESFGYSC